MIDASQFGISAVVFEAFVPSKGLEEIGRTRAFCVVGVGAVQDVGDN